MKLVMAMNEDDFAKFLFDYHPAFFASAIASIVLVLVGARPWTVKTWRFSLLSLTLPSILYGFLFALFKDMNSAEGDTLDFVFGWLLFPHSFIAFALLFLAAALAYFKHGNERGLLKALCIAAVLSLILSELWLQMIISALESDSAD